LANRDYAANGWYYFTIKCKNNNEYFGSVLDANMDLSPIGRIAKDIWEMIPEHFSYIELDEMIIMPDHMHGILHFDKDDSDGSQKEKDAIHRLWKASSLHKVLSMTHVKTRFIASISCMPML
jgi:REP element-mobilizing transposase RayT